MARKAGNGKTRAPLITPFTPYLERAIERARKAKEEMRKSLADFDQAITAVSNREGCSRNVEVKAKVDDLSAVGKKARSIVHREHGAVTQEDTYFRHPEGRLKLRRVGGEKAGELIFYRRMDMESARESCYAILPLQNADAALSALSKLYDVIGQVRKSRTVILCGTGRIHLDDVDGLGSFVEIEVVLREGERAEAGKAIAEDLMGRLGIAKKSMIGQSYIDLVIAAGGGTNRGNV